MRFKHVPLLLSLVALLSSCGGSSQSSSSKEKEWEFVLGRAPVKTVYKAGEYFSRSGLVALKKTEGEKTKAVQGYDIFPARPLTEDDQDVIISYNGKSISIPVTVEGEIGDQDQTELFYPWGRLNEDYDEEIVGAPSSITLAVKDAPAYDSPDFFDIHSDAQRAYLGSGYNSYAKYNNGQKDISKPRPYTIEIEENGEFYLEIARDLDFSDAVRYDHVEGSFDFYNGYLGETYYWRYADSVEGLKDASIEQFYIAPIGPRVMFIEGVQNVRDIGGYPSKLGGVVRQGLYYRGGRLNKSSVNTYSEDITEEGKITLIDDLGIRTEIDLRMNEFTTPVAPTTGWEKNEYGKMDDSKIEEIAYEACPLNWNHSDMMKIDKEMIGNVFHLFAKEENYPFYLHCNIGTDRTGMISFLLGALTGMYLEDIYRDYLFSNFASISGNRDASTITDKYQKDLLQYGEKNLYLDARAYLIDCGLTEDELDFIVNQFVDFSAL